MEQIQELARICDEMERKLLHKLLLDAAEYVRAVVVMETTAMNIGGEEGSAWRDEVQSTDQARRTIHNGLIMTVNIVNRICQKYGKPPVYQGSDARREYGDFALRLVREVFEKRN